MGENIRGRILEFERSSLSPYAACCEDTKGRALAEDECPVRTAYQRDRDRIIHSNAFRRLKDKTQVFLSPESAHYRTRLTHTLEVSQIARTIARGLRLNEDLTEAIALGHDLGHTPFGHAGERALDGELKGGFTHYGQGVRVVDTLEKDGAGLNLTYEVRDGIFCHTSATKPAETLEGRVVSLSDRVAYVNHDIDDAIRAGVMSVGDIPKNIRGVLGKTKSESINTLVISAINESGDDIRLGAEAAEAFEELHSLMFKTVYIDPVCKGEEGKAVELVKSLYRYYSENTEGMPELYRKIAGKEGRERAAADYISGMSDRFATGTYERLFVPSFW
ncbi:MAG: deoxyguanosinetriphosphate triphosphohydrolase [Oscillospiraceae bacterium]|nr:deoxyguanosinetriphosphate triphosphohydrolase [Oscillospiraceae bacterium]